MTAPAANRRIFVIGGQHAEPLTGDAPTMGFKAYNLARMAAIGLPVPPAFVLATGYCRDYVKQEKKPSGELRELLAANLRRVEAGSSLTFGGARKPMLVSVRSGAPVSMPGMMETMLTVGLTEATLRGLLRMTGNPRLVWDSYRRLVQSFAAVVHGVPARRFEAVLDEYLKRGGVARAHELDGQLLAALARDYLELHHELTGAEFPQDPLEQLDAAVRAVFRSWLTPRAVEYRRLHHIDEGVGTAVTVQRMVFGNAGGGSGSGVAFTRDPATGENRLYLDFLFNAQGEDVVSGRHALHDSEQLGAVLPRVMQQILNVRHALEAEFKDVQEFEFTIQDGKLYLLQTRTGKRTAPAALRIAVEQVREGLITTEEALVRLQDVDLERIEEVHVAADADAPVLCTATSASVGVATGAIALDVEAAKQMAKRQPVILVRHDTTTDDIDGLAAASGLLTAVGGRTSHAAVVARQLNKVCLVGCAGLSIDVAGRSCRIGGRKFVEGDALCLDANGGRVLAGRPKLVVAKPPEFLAEVERWRGARAADAVA
ncbi:MAG: pyruvate, phosphate dikinase [Betaproteobacteria bacterium]|nr:pyruvate, phosphate dikinase [Betaproteobacteria bacterium]